MKRTFQLTGAPHETLTALDAGGAGDNLPSRIRLLAWGENPSTKGVFRVGPGTLAALTANQKRFGFGRVALDFQHNTVPGTPAYNEAKEPRPVAAYGIPQVVEGEGLFLTALSWTPEGRANAGNYRAVSATVAQDEQGEVIFMHSAAICRQGAVPGMELVAASVELAEAAPAVTPLDADTMAAVVNAVGDKLRDAEWRKREVDELRASLDKANQTNTALQTALDAMAAQIRELKAALESSATAAAPMTGLTALTADVSALRSQLSASQDKAERDLLLLGARLQGKLIPLSADKLPTVELDTLRNPVANAKPGQVPLSRVTPLSVDPGTLSGPSPQEKAEADRIYRRAQRISAQNPRWQWSRCWAEAQAGAA